MRRRNSIGLDELMIVNPGALDDGFLFLGEDGTLYQLEAINQEDGQVLGGFYFGEEGAGYRLDGLELDD